MAIIGNISKAQNHYYNSAVSLGHILWNVNTKHSYIIK